MKNLKPIYKTYMFLYQSRGGGIVLQPQSSVMFDNGRMIGFCSSIYFDEMLNTFEQHNMPVFNIGFFNNLCAITVIDRYE